MSTDVIKLISSLLYYGKEKYHPIKETENQPNKQNKNSNKKNKQTENKKKKNN